MLADLPPTAAVPVVLAYAGFAVVGCWLAAIDIADHRLPDRIVLPTAAGGTLLLTLGCLGGAPWTALVRAGVGMVALFAFFLVLRLVSPGGMGGGDVKLAGAVGLFLGWAGWGAVAVGVLSAFLLGGLCGLLLLALRRAGRRTAIPFGPFLIVGAWVGILFGDAVWGDVGALAGSG